MKLLLAVTLLILAIFGVALYVNGLHGPPQVQMLAFLPASIASPALPAVLCSVAPNAGGQSGVEMTVITTNRGGDQGPHIDRLQGATGNTMKTVARSGTFARCRALGSVVPLRV